MQWPKQKRVVNNYWLTDTDYPLTGW